MLEAMFQASMWLVRVTERFEKSTVVLREARGVKYQDFVQPGDSLAIESELVSIKDGLYQLKVKGKISGGTATSARLIVDSFNLADRMGLDQAIDDFRRNEFKLNFRRLCDQREFGKLADVESQVEIP